MQISDETPTQQGAGMEGVEHSPTDTPSSTPDTGAPHQVGGIAIPGLQARVFLAPKSGEALTTCADAAHVSALWGAAAISDGVSEALRAGVWAHRLVWHFTAEDAGATPPASLESTAIIDWVDNLRPEHNEELLSWAATKNFFFQQKAEEFGSQATFLGLRFAPLRADGSLSFRALAVGDTCLFLWARDETAPTKAWPVSDREGFGRTPAVVGSFTQHGPLPEDIEYLDGTLQPDMLMVLATDAIAERLLRKDLPFDPWQARDWDQTAFGTWLVEGRARNEIHNDDSTLIIVWREETPTDMLDSAVRRFEFEEPEVLPPPRSTLHTIIENKSEDGSSTSLSPEIADHPRTEGGAVARTGNAPIADRGSLIPDDSPDHDAQGTGVANCYVREDTVTADPSIEDHLRAEVVRLTQERDALHADLEVALARLRDVENQNGELFSRIRALLASREDRQRVDEEPPLSGTASPMVASPTPLSEAETDGTAVSDPDSQHATEPRDGLLSRFFQHMYGRTAAKNERET